MEELRSLWLRRRGGGSISPDGDVLEGSSCCVLFGLFEVCMRCGLVTAASSAVAFLLTTASAHSGGVTREVRETFAVIADVVVGVLSDRALLLGIRSWYGPG